MSTLQSSTPGSGPERRIALIKPSASEEQAGHAVQLFDSVLWVFKGSTRSSWITTPAAAADIVVVHHSEPSDNVERWRDEGKHIVVLSTDEKQHPAGPRTLVYPFPAVQVLSMLERVEAELDNSAGAHSRHIVATVASSVLGNEPRTESWTFVEALRTLRTVSNPNLWLTCKGPHGPFLWLPGDVSRFFCDEPTAAAIRAGTLDLDGFTLLKGMPPPGNLSPRPSDELLWFATWHASSSLAPWLNETSTYRLIRWPDLGRLRAIDAAERTAQIRVVAALYARPTTFRSLATRAQATASQTARTLNALGSCGLIEATHEAITVQPAREATPPPAPAPSFKQFLRNMRKHLRLGGLS